MFESSMANRPAPLRTLTAALSLEEALERCAAGVARQLARPLARAKLLPEYGSVDLPDSAAASDAVSLATAAPLYLAHELQRAGLFRCAEQVAALFASGAMTIELGTSAALITEFWRERGTRFTDAERSQLLDQAFDAGRFDPQMRALCAALTAFADNRRVEDVRERVALEQARAQLASFLGIRLQGMLAYAAQELTDTINRALAFLRDRVLQTAFGAHDLWELIEICGRLTGSAPPNVRAHVDLARSGVDVLSWLAKGTTPVNAGAPDASVQAAAIRWLTAFESARRPGDARIAA